MSTYHDILGITPGASQQEIKQAFRRRALECHPDQAEESEKEAAQQEFLRVREAFEVLSGGEEGDWTLGARDGADTEDSKARSRGSRRSYKEKWQNAKKVRVSKDIVDRVQGLSREYDLIRQKNKITVPVCALLVALVYVFEPMTLYGSGLFFVDLILSGLVGGAYGLAVGSVWAYLEIFFGEDGA
jgi:hypothetical protein